MTCFLLFTGLLHRTKTHYVSSASLMFWTQPTPNRAALVTRAFMGTCAFTLASLQKTQITLTSANTLNLLQTSFIKAWRAKMVYLFKYKYVLNWVKMYFLSIFLILFSPLFSSGKVLVHCIMGVSRSATLVLSYLMLKHSFSLRDALRHIVKKRAIYPNRNFLTLLLKLDEELTRKRMLCPVLWHNYLPALSLACIILHFDHMGSSCK